jgi:hypothetical protein
VTDDPFGKPLPCPPGASYAPIVRMPRPPPRHRELTPEERAERKASADRVSAAAVAEHNRLLAEGMQSWITRAREKWLRAGGYGFPLSPEDEAAIRAAGFEPAPLDRPPK